MDEFRNPRTLELAKALVANQAHLNSTAYSTEWLEKGRTREFHYLVAASQELAEFINSYWLPWWSKAERDMANCRIELVDALHFLLSEAIIQYGEEAAAEEIASTYDAAKYVMDKMAEQFKDERDGVLELARLAVASVNVEDENGLDITPFFMLALSIDFDIEKLSALYLGKSTLNKFRQDKGYKQGTYKKKWDGKNEDNYFMSVWIDQLQDPPSVEQIRVWLEAQYIYYTQND
jgi:dimeric dUTPase (all-alpha-NTP-PPase superfamily)